MKGGERHVEGIMTVNGVKLQAKK